MKTLAALYQVAGSMPALVAKSTSAQTSRTWRRWLVGTLLCVAFFFAGSIQAQIIQTIYVLTTDGKLAAAPIGNPAPISSGIAITGVTAGETLVGIDVRPQNQQLYALGVNATTDTATLYRLSAETGYAAVVGTASSIAFVDAAGGTVQLPDPAFYSWDIDFNPLADRVRVVCGSLNFRVNPNNGTPVDGNLANGTPAGTNPDGPINGLTVNVDATAYTNSQPNTTITTQYTIDAVTNSIYIQNPPNNGTETGAQPLKLAIAGTPLNPVAVSGFDIPSEVKAPSSNSPVASGAGYAVLTVGTTSSLYAIDLTNGGAVELGTLEVRSFAIRAELGAAIAMTSDGLNLVRFSTDTPGTTTTVGITGITGGETLVGIDLRPQTGQLYALGINHTANNGTLYLLDPQLGSLTAVGTTGQIAYVAADGVTPIDLPDPATVGYGVDFNPTVDRLRVVTGSGLNFRARPDTGAPVDGNGGTPGTNPDGTINGGVITGVEATAYTNSFPRDLAVPLVTTQYTLDATTNTLNIQNPPNNGTQSVGLQVTLNLNPLDFTALNGFDIPAGVSVGTSNSVAKGEGWFVAAVGGVTGLYRIDLQTGAAVSIGAVGSGSTPFAGFVVNTTAVAGAEFPAGTPLTDSLGVAGFGTTTLGNAVTNMIKVTNKGTQALTYTLSLDTGAPFSIVSSPVGTIAPGGSTNIQVGFDPQTAVEATDTLHILSNDPAIPSFDVFLIGSGSTALGDDAIAVTSGDTRLNVLANDGLSGVAVITGVSDSSIVIDGRTLIIPSGYTGTFTYTTQEFDGTIGQATVTVTAGTAVVNPTTYSGLLRLDTGEPAGSATVTISAGGVATLQLVGGTVKVKTKITVATIGSFGIGFTPLGPILLSRNPDGTVDVLVGALGGEIGGTLLAVNTAAAKAKHHIALATLDPMVPGGGFAVAQGGVKGAVKVTGLLPDGVPFSVGTAIRENGTIAVYIPITKGLKRPAFVGGELVVADLADTDVTGELSWVKLIQPAGAKGLHLGGVNTTLTANGSLYDGTAALPDGSGTFVIAGGNMGTHTGSVEINAGIPDTGEFVKWIAKKKTGQFTTKVDLGSNKFAKGSGLYLPKSNSAWGFFPGTTEGGLIQLTVP